MKTNVIAKSLLISVCLSSLVLLDGCVAVARKAVDNNGTAVATTDTKYASTKSSQVKVYSVAPAHYQVIGHVTADNDNRLGVAHSQSSITKELQKQAASLGANGVTNITTTTETTNADAIIVQK